MPEKWLRGPAWIDGDDIVMDLSRATSYQALAERTIGIELSRVRTPEHAVSFVRRFGLLRATRLRRSWITGEDSDAPLHELFTEFEVEAARLRDILEVVLLVRQGSNGDAESIRRLRAKLVISEDRDLIVQDPSTGERGARLAGDLISPVERFYDADDRTILMNASQWAADRLNASLRYDRAPPFVFDRAFVGEPVPPGAWRIGMAPDSLAGVCNLSVALALADREPIDICQEQSCRQVFFVTDGRQKFCTPACANRSRYRRFKAKARTAAKPED